MTKPTVAALFARQDADPYLQAICLAIWPSIAGGHGRAGGTQEQAAALSLTGAGNGDHVVARFLGLSGMTSVVAQT